MLKLKQRTEDKKHISIDLKTQIKRGILRITYATILVSSFSNYT